MHKLTWATAGLDLSGHPRCVGCYLFLFALRFRTCFYFPYSGIFLFGFVFTHKSEFESGLLPYRIMHVKLMKYYLLDFTFSGLAYKIRRGKNE